ncbi:MAG: glycosyltransferase family 2 protein [Methylococcaceae bacterium]|nr:glycosyltransferase family 2 protein [Methylococcaceae bacterium]
MEKVSVIIPNWNGQRFLQVCFDSLAAQTYKDFAVYLVDNGSADDSLSYVKLNYPDINIIALPENFGFSAAINAGINGSKGELVAALNNDTASDPKWLEEIVNVMDSRADIGFCASLLLDFNDRTIIDSFGDNYSLIGLSGKIATREDFRVVGDEPTEVFSACAAASVYRRSMLDKIGHFDEDFFCYMEDVDIGIRAQLVGYRCLAIPAAKVYHIGSASTGGDMSAFSLSMTAKNLICVLIKDMPLLLLLVMLPLSLAAQALLVLESLLTDRRPKFKKNLSAYFNGLGQGLRLLPLMLQKRKQIQATRTVSVVQLAKLIYQSRAQNLAFRK